MEPSTIPLTRAQMTHMARFAFEALGIELTGQPDTSANNANEMKSRTMKKLIAVAGLGTAVALGSLVGAGTASADNFTVCPSGMSGVSTDDTSCAFADNVRWAWYSQPGNIVTAYSPVTHQSYTMQCTPTATTFWPVAKRCVGVNSYGVGLIVFID